MKKVLFSGCSEKAGSWLMRGVQIASTRPHWKASVNVHEADVIEADIIVVVKRVNRQVVEWARKHHKKLVYDMLDFWCQDNTNATPQDLCEAILLAKKQLSKIEPDAVICANAAMARDITAAGMRNVIHIYHHYRLDAAPAAGGKVIYYDGSPKHAQKWLNVLKKIAAQHGYEVRNDIPRADAAALFSARDHDVWIAKRWKSNVKAANAYGFCLPLITMSECGALETLDDGLALYYDDSETLAGAVAALKENRPYTDMIKRQRYSLPFIAADYAKLFEAL